MTPLSVQSMQAVTLGLVIVVAVVVYATQQTTLFSSAEGGMQTTLQTSIAPPPPLDDKGVWWEYMSHRFCPKMIPDYRITSMLFPLARLELIGNISEVDMFPSLNFTLIQQDHEPPFDKFAKSFYSWAPGWGGLSRPSDGPDRAMFSMPKMYKVANNQLDAFWQQVFEDLLPGTSPKKIREKKDLRPRFRDRFLPYKNETKPLKECMVIVIRDPISHFLSAYNEVQYRVERHSPKKKENYKHWPASAFETGSLERFQQFIIDFLSFPISRNFPGIRNVTQSQSLELHHANSMSSVLSLLSGELETYNLEREVHVLPTIQGLEENLGPFIVKSCPGSFSNSTTTKILTTQMDTSLGAHPTSSDPFGSYNASKQVFRDGGPFARALCAMHLMDYACWPGLPDGVPEVCMDVYASYYERGVLWK